MILLGEMVDFRAGAVEIQDELEHLEGRKKKKKKRLTHIQRAEDTPERAPSA